MNIRDGFFVDCDDFVIIVSGLVEICLDECCAETTGGACY